MSIAGKICFGVNSFNCYNIQGVNKTLSDKGGSEILAICTV